MIQFFNVNDCRCVEACLRPCSDLRHLPTALCNCSPLTRESSAMKTLVTKRIMFRLSLTLLIGPHLDETDRIRPTTCSTHVLTCTGKGTDSQLGERVLKPQGECVTIFPVKGRERTGKNLFRRFIEMKQHTLLNDRDGKHIYSSTRRRSSPAYHPTPALADHSPHESNCVAPEPFAARPK